MATEIPTIASPGASSGAAPYRLSADQFLRMIDVGIFPGAARVELLDGILAAKLTRKPPHDFTVGVVSQALRAVLPADRIVREEKSIESRELGKIAVSEILPS